MVWQEPRQCLHRHRDRLLRCTNVVGVGIGYKWVKGQPTPVRCVQVFVRKKLPVDALKPRDVVPPVLDGVPTDVTEVGDVRLLGHLAAGDAGSGRAGTGGCDSGGELGDEARRERLRPACPGVSVAHYLVTAGTLGALVRDAPGQLYILSNNHVLANSSDGRDGRAERGDPILQPGPYDGGTDPADRIAVLDRFLPLRGRGEENEADAALGALLAPEDAVPELFGLGPVTGVGQARMGMPVQFSGRTSGVRKGTVLALEVTVDVGMATGVTARFVNQVATTPIAQPGDSGSLVVDGFRRAVGLLFAGSAQISLANPIGPVLDRLGVTLL